ncbi:MAG TPA: hypothetical protein VFK40_03470 [Nitrososphaeraceae archaeon]|nr:hypothetical protein [Nitrososphaeraceae archaeon]
MTDDYNNDIFSDISNLSDEDIAKIKEQKLKDLAEEQEEYIQRQSMKHGFPNLSNGNGNSNNVNKGDDDKDKKPKQEYTVFKCSQNGKIPLHEAVIVNRLPFFMKYDVSSQTFELVEKFEENNRILVPPNEENYPSSPPYSFDSREELEFFMLKARIVTLDQLLIFSKNIFKKF